MSPPEGRAPHPKGGDPNVKTIRLSLTPGEWRKLRLWAATQDSSMNQLVRDIVRRELEHRPGQGF
jgi:plasmid stability protein